MSMGIFPDFGTLHYGRCELTPREAAIVPLDAPPATFAFDSTGDYKPSMEITL